MKIQRSMIHGSPHLPDSCKKPRSQRQSCPSFKDSSSKSIFYEEGSKSNDRVETNLHAGPSSLNKFVSAKCKNRSWFLPGNLVWAIKANNDWWPAEIIDASSLLKITGSYSIGRNLVKFFGNNALAWLDPSREISEFNSFYEERSKNSSVIFQDALDQALQKHFNSSPEIAPLKSTSSHDTDSSPSGSKRIRKTKIHFDDLTVSEKPAKRIRRIKIMRHLGLMAPAGSPFCLPRVRSSLQ